MLNFKTLRPHFFPLQWLSKTLSAFTTSLALRSMITLHLTPVPPKDMSQLQSGNGIETSCNRTWQESVKCYIFIIHCPNVAHGCRFIQLNIISIVDVCQTCSAVTTTQDTSLVLSVPVPQVIVSVIVHLCFFIPNFTALRNYFEKTAFFVLSLRSIYTKCKRHRWLMSIHAELSWFSDWEMGKVHSLGNCLHYFLWMYAVANVNACLLLREQSNYCTAVSWAVEL